MVREVVVVALLMASTAAQAGDNSSTLSDPDTESARRHFHRGAELYEGERYADAVREFETAKRIKSAPAFEFNIARCRDRLEEWGSAADGYERYLFEVPNAPERDELRARIAELRARAGTVVPSGAAITSEAPRKTRWWLWTSIGVVLVGGMIGIVAATSSGGQTAAIPPSKDGNFTVTF